MTDRRKFNFNLLLVGMLIIIFGTLLYNQQLLLQTTDRIFQIEKKLDQYFEPPLPDFN
jgi:hypothetical protein